MPYLVRFPLFFLECCLTLVLLYQWKCSTPGSYDFVLTRVSLRSVWFGWLGITPVSAYIALGSRYQAGLETRNDPVISGLLGQLG